mmetsp:Transcript_25747/g.54770  ORF Transcript_25747/g.54770 Transcript_25747/m.54770 type:complete len:223 (-) Transcript_25747:556-1224(-)
MLQHSRASVSDGSREASETIYGRFVGHVLQIFRQNGDERIQPGTHIYRSSVIVATRSKPRGTNRLAQERRVFRRKWQRLLPKEPRDASESSFIRRVIHRRKEVNHRLLHDARKVLRHGDVSRGVAHANAAMALAHFFLLASRAEQLVDPVEEREGPVRHGEHRFLHQRSFGVIDHRLLSEQDGIFGQGSHSSFVILRFHKAVPRFRQSLPDLHGPFCSIAIV